MTKWCWIPFHMLIGISIMKYIFKFFLLDYLSFWHWLVKVYYILDISPLLNIYVLQRTSNCGMRERFYINRDSLNLYILSYWIFQHCITNAWVLLLLLFIPPHYVGPSLTQCSPRDIRRKFTDFLVICKIKWVLCN